jgi:hypothetical protein
MRVILRLLVIWFLVVSGTVQADSQKTEVIPLGYRSLAEMLPVLRPLVTPGGSVSGLRDQLVVTGSPEQLARVQQVLAQLDRPPARLVISVRQGRAVNRRHDSASVQGRIANLELGGDSAKIGQSANIADDEAEIQARVMSRMDDHDEQLVQRVQVLEGNEAHIYTGVLLGVPASAPYSPRATAYYPAVSGFYVVPRVNGEQVQLRLSTVSQRQALSHGGRSYGGPARPWIDTSGVATQVGGRLGEWIAVAESATDDEARQSSIGGVSRRDDSVLQTIYLKVEKLAEQ